jgi:hypothetical protein
MASLSFVHEVARATIVDRGMLPIIHASLSHPSYGVRAAACQATRALSRSIAVLRTSLVDSGLAAKVLEILKEEDERIGSGSLGRLSIAGRDEKDDTVLIAATATICNLITEFSPMQTVSRPLNIAERDSHMPSPDVDRRGRDRLACSPLQFSQRRSQNQRGVGVEKYDLQERHASEEEGSGQFDLDRTKAVS